MLLDGSRSHDTVILVDLRAKEQKGLPRLKSWRAAQDTVNREAQAAASGNIGGLLAWLVTLSKGPHCPHYCSVGFV